MNKVYEFVGGAFNGEIFSAEDAYRLHGICGSGYSSDWSQERECGACVPRVELDNELQFKGYLGPMWDGTRRINGEKVYVLRYETQEVYDMLSH